MKIHLALILIAATLCPSATAAGPDTVVVCPTAFRQALTPWLEYRKEQGRKITVLDVAANQEALRKNIRQLAKQGSLKYIVLVGDAKETGVRHQPRLQTVPDENNRSTDAPQVIPTHLREARVNIHWGGAPDLACDNWYADFDDDTIPDAAIGRLTADTPAELTQIINKTIAYENSKNFGLWRRRANFVAGVGGFGVIADRALESAARSILTRGIPSSHAITMTYASWRSPYSPHPLAFRQACTKRLNQGCLFWVYIGHGSQRQLDRVRVPGAAYPIFDTRDVSNLDCEHGLPIAVFLACHTGAIDAHNDCLAEELLRKSGAPVAILAGSRVTMPYGMSVFGVELIDQVFKHRCQTLGEAMNRAQREAVKKKPDDPFRGSLDSLARLISPQGTELLAEREETIHQFNLLGDPLLRLPQPEKISLSVAKQATAGEKLIVSGHSEHAGVVTVELTSPRGRLRFRAPKREEYAESPEAQVHFANTYREANNPSYCTAQTRVENGQFQATLEVPATAKGKCRIRVFIEGVEQFGVGASDIEIVVPTK